MGNPEQSIDDLRTIAEELSNISNLSENQALAYTFRAIGGMDRQETVMEMDVNPSTLDTHFQRSKQKMNTARSQAYYADIFQGNTSNLREGATLPTVPTQWRSTPFEFEDGGAKIEVFELPDNRFAKCKRSSSDQRRVEITSVGSFSVETPSFGREGFEDYFKELGIDLTLTKDSYINLAVNYQTMIEYSIARRLDGLRISNAQKYLKVTNKNLGNSPSWMEVNSIDELVFATISEGLKGTKQLRELKEEFMEIYQPGEHTVIDPGQFDGEGKEMQFYAHIGLAFCRATETDHPLTFDWDIEQKQRHITASDEQTNRFYKRKHYQNANRHRDDMIQMHAGVDLSSF